MRTGVVAGIVLLMSLTGCSSGVAAQPEVTSPSRTSTPVPEGQVFCRVWLSGNSDYVDWILSAATKDIDINEFYDQQAYVTKLRSLAPEEVDGVVEDYAGPVDAVQRASDAGGGDLSFNTDGFKAANTTLLTYCAGRTD